MERCGGVRRAPQKTRVKDEVKQTRVQNSDKMVYCTGKNQKQIRHDTGKNYKQIRHVFRNRTKWSNAMVQYKNLQLTRTCVHNSDKMVSCTGKNWKQIRQVFRIQTKWSNALVKMRSNADKCSEFRQNVLMHWLKSK